MARRGISSLGSLGGQQFTVMPAQPSYGDAVASILGSALEGIAERKKEQLGTQRVSTSLQQLGFSDQESQALAQLPSELRETFIKQLAERGYTGGGVAPQPMQPLQQLGQMTPADETPPAQEVLQALGQQLQQPPGMRDIGLGQPRTAAEALRMPTRKEAREEAKLDIQQQKLALQQEKAESQKEYREWKDTEKLREKLYDKKEGALKDIEVLENMRDLVENGELDSPAYIAMMENAGLGDIGALFSPGTQQFKKERQQFMKRLRPLFGGRITNLELQQFIQGIPDLMQSPEGQQRIISQFLKEAKINAAGWDTMWEILDENKGKPPRDLERQIDKRLEKVRDKAAKEFKEDLKRPIPPAPSRLATFGGAALGKLPAMALGGAKGAALGAAGGSAVPAIGTTTGGIAGGILGALGGLAS